MVVAVYGRSYLGTPGFLPAGLEGVASGLVGFLVPVVVAGRSSLGTPGFLLMGSVGRGLGLGFLGLPSGRLMPEERGGTRGLSGISSLANAGVDFWILGVGYHLRNSTRHLYTSGIRPDTYTVYLGSTISLYPSRKQVASRREREYETKEENQTSCFHFRETMLRHQQLS